MTAFVLLLLRRWSRRTGGRIALVVPFVVPLLFLGAPRSIGVAVDTLDPVLAALAVATWLGAPVTGNLVAAAVHD